MISHLALGIYGEIDVCGGLDKSFERSDSLMEMDADIGKIFDAIRAEAPNTIVTLTADNGVWLDAYPDAGTTPFRGEKGSSYEGGWRVPGIMSWPGHIPAGVQYGEMTRRLLWTFQRKVWYFFAMSIGVGNGRG